MSTPAQKPRPTARHDDRSVVGHPAGLGDRVGEVEPGGHVEGIDGGMVEHDLGHTGTDLL